MKRIHSLAIAATLLVAGASIAEAQGYSRSGGGTGPRGGSWSSSGSGSCTKGAGCSSQGAYKYTGPGGQTYTASRRSGTACSGGSCTRSSTWSR